MRLALAAHAGYVFNYEPEIQCGYGELLFSGLPTGSCQMKAAQASGATPNWFALAGSWNQVALERQGWSGSTG